MKIRQSLQVVLDSCLCCKGNNSFFVFSTGRLEISVLAILKMLRYQCRQNVDEMCQNFHDCQKILSFCNILSNTDTKFAC